VRFGMQSLVGKLSNSEAFFRVEGSSWKGQSLSDVTEQIQGLARRLYSFGVSEESVVAICCDDDLDGVWVEQAVWLLGGTTIWIAESTDDGELLKCLGVSRASLFVLSPADRYGALEDGLDELEDLMMVFSLKDDSAMVPLVPAAASSEWLAALSPPSPAATALLSGAGNVMTILDRKALDEIVVRALHRQLTGQRVLICADLSRIEVRIILWVTLLQQRTLYWSPASQELPAPLLRMVRPQTCVLSRLGALSLPTGFERWLPKRWHQHTLGGQLKELHWLGNGLTHADQLFFERSGIRFR